MTNTLAHIQNLQAAAIDLESQLRNAGAYSRDCARVNDAITRGQKSGVALLWGADGKMEVVDLNGGSKHVNVRETDANGVVVEHDFSTWNVAGPDEAHSERTRGMTEQAEMSPYSQVSGETFKTAVAQSHERANAAGNNFPAQNIEGRKVSTADTARLAEKRKAMTADARRFTEEQFARNERFAAMQKEARSHK
jgi:hypothetical protein